MQQFSKPLELFERAYEFGDRIAVADGSYQFGYRDVLNASSAAASNLITERKSLSGVRVAILVSPGIEFVAALWGVWRAGGIAVPLCIFHPQAELAYVLDDCTPELIIADRELKAKIAPLAKERDIQVLNSWEILEGQLRNLPSAKLEDTALIIYTSGTTGQPKGVVITHEMIRTQVTSLVEAWEWSSKDRILNVLPLHHVHGLINILMCSLWSGACCELMPEFDPEQVCRRFAQGGLTLFMAVPTVYDKLIRNWEAQDKKTRGALARSCKKFRLFVSGSSALPVSLYEEFRKITGRRILERYGMTEFGMALSNPLKGDRRPGTVGTPLPGLEVRLVDENGSIVGENTSGEIQVRGPSVFKEYWNRPEETAAAFTGDGWFRTGDIALVEDGYFRILGRINVDIINTGGYNVSALEVEHVLQEHPSILEAAVVSVPDETWGERVAVAIVEKPGSDITPGWLRGWAKKRIASYKVPTLLLKLNALPRNSMGKVNKQAIISLFESENH